MTLTVQSKPDHLKSRGSGPDTNSLVTLTENFSNKENGKEITYSLRGYLQIISFHTNKINDSCADTEECKSKPRNKQT